jgi:N-acetylneuraminic acid mutarotase
MRRILSIITIGLFVVILCSTPAFSQTGKWTQLFPKNSPPGRGQFGMAYLEDDKVMIFGGDGDKPQCLGDTWIYDLSDNEWTEVKCDTSPKPRTHPVMVYIGDGKALLFGGCLNNGTNYGDDTWIFDIKTMKWKELHPVRKPYRRDRASYAYLGNNQILLYSGFNCPLEYSVFQDGFCHDTWIYDLNKNEWDSISNNFPRGRELAQMCELSQNEIALYGGHTTNYITTNPGVYIFSKITKKWQLLIPKIPNILRTSSAMVQLMDNVTFVFGGDTQGNPGTTAENKCDNDSWILDMGDSTWVELQIDLKPQGRYLHNMAKIGEGKVLLFSGCTKEETITDTWLFEYDPTGVKDSTNILFAQVKVINKANGNCEIQISNLSAGTIEMELYNTNGDFIKQLYSNYNAQPNLNLEVNTAEFSSGAYFLEIKTKDATYHKQIMVVR